MAAGGGVPTLTPDLVYKRDVLRGRLGQELGDRTFRKWLERSLAAVTPEPEEPAVAEPAPENGHDTHSGREADAPRGMRAAHGPGGNSAPGNAGAGAIPADRDPDAADSGPGPCARRNGDDAHPETPEEPEPEAATISDASVEEEEVVAPEPAPRGGCLWPEGEPPALTWCGAKRSPGRSYCPEHCRRAFRGNRGETLRLEYFHSPPPQAEAA